MIQNKEKNNGESFEYIYLEIFLGNTSKNLINNEI